MTTAPFDFHTHRPDAYRALISIDPRHFVPEPGKWYSVGYHPWDTNHEMLQDDHGLLEQCATNPQVLAIGETGMDHLRGASIEVQRQVFAWHLKMASAISKPVVVHTVRTSQEVISLRRSLHLVGVTMAIHGMRANERVARLLLDEGCYLSFGPKFNPNALRETPLDRLLIETDDSSTPIEDVAASVAAHLHISVNTVISTTSDNAHRLLQIP